jgi:hypothetical protein
MDDLPKELQTHVLSFLSFSDLFKIKRTNHMIHDYASNNMLDRSRDILQKRFPVLMDCLQGIDDYKIYGGYLAYVMGIAQNNPHNTKLFIDFKSRDSLSLLYRRLKHHVVDFGEANEYGPCRAFVYRGKDMRIVLHLTDILMLYLPLPIEDRMFIMTPSLFRTDLKIDEEGDPVLIMNMYQCDSNHANTVALIMNHSVKLLLVPARKKDVKKIQNTQKI